MSLVNFLSLSRQCRRFKKIVIRLLSLLLKAALEQSGSESPEMSCWSRDWTGGLLQCLQGNENHYVCMIMKGKDIANGLISVSLVNVSDLPATDLARKSLIQRFLKKRGISFRKTHGESVMQMTLEGQHFLEGVWPDCLQVLTMTAAECTTWMKLGSFGERFPHGLLPGSTSAC